MASGAKHRTLITIFDLDHERDVINAGGGDQSVFVRERGLHGPARQHVIVGERPGDPGRLTHTTVAHYAQNASFVAV